MFGDPLKNFSEGKIKNLPAGTGTHRVPHS
jgi:hypothetical protein